VCIVGLCYPKDTTENVHLEREHIVDAAIVRIMKSSSVMKQQQLIVQVEQHLSRFKPDSALIATRIKCLVQREFLKELQDKPEMLRYLP